MKASDLMIGDLVHIAGYIEPRAHSITAIKPDEFGDYFALLDEDDVWWDITCLAPIPITPEILEENGFEKGIGSDIYGIVVGDCCLHYYFTGRLEKTLHVTIFSPDDRILHIWTIPAKYVHELQNALRLCKIEKEIEL